MRAPSNESTEVPITGSAIRHCPKCNGYVFHAPQHVRVYAANRKIYTVRFWACEVHPLPKILELNTKETR